MARPALLSILLASAATLAIASDDQTTCTVPSRFAASNGNEDDSPAINAAFAKCAHHGIVLFPKGTDYAVLTSISAKNLSNVEIRMGGNLHLPKNLTYVQEYYNTTVGSGNLYWFTFAGDQVHYIGTPNVTTGWINSYGQAWWYACDPLCTLSVLA